MAMFSSPTAGFQAYGAGKGFTWQPQGSSGDRRARAFDQASSHLRSALDNQAGAFNQASNAATQFGVEEMRMNTQKDIAKMQADAAAKAQRKASSGIGGAGSFLSTAASFIPVVGKLFG